MKAATKIREEEDRKLIDLARQNVKSNWSENVRLEWIQSIADSRPTRDAWVFHPEGEHPTVALKASRKVGEKTVEEIMFVFNPE